MQNDQHMGTIEDRGMIIGIRDGKDDTCGVIGRLVDDGLIGLPEVCGVDKVNMTLLVLRYFQWNRPTPRLTI